MPRGRVLSSGTPRDWPRPTPAQPRGSARVMAVCQSECGRCVLRRRDAGCLAVVGVRMYGKRMTDAKQHAGRVVAVSGNR